MIVTYALKDCPKNTKDRSKASYTADVFGLQLPALNIAGGMFIDLNTFLSLLRFPSSERKNVMKTIGYWKGLFAKNPRAVHGVVVAAGSHYYADWGFLISATKYMGVVVQQPIVGEVVYAAEKATQWFRQLYRGCTDPGAPGSNTTALKWEQFYEVIPHTVSGRSWKTSKDKGLCNIPVPAPKVPARQDVEPGLVKPTEDAKAMPLDAHVDCSTAHNIDKASVLQATANNDKSVPVSVPATEPVLAENSAVTSLSGIISLIQQLAAGRKLSINITMELK